ncbi:MAG TPA: succinate dehydrogenase assembly factor 2 [Roseiarcus sp.]|jgi:antitoxin CptB|nr:succinate dehydrogenase assembly factor 2 [Roseiarcus sp.]
MTGSTISSARLDARRRRVLFRAWRRGLREMDLVMGHFADLEIATMSEADLAEFERLLDVPDPEILSWITGEKPAPAEHDTALLARLGAAPAAAALRKRS